MIAWFKSQWFSILVGLLNLGISIWNLSTGNKFMAACWLVSSVVWLIMSRVNHNEERIQRLEEKEKKYDAMNEKFEAMQEYIETLERACGYKNGYVYHDLAKIKEEKKCQ